MSNADSHKVAELANLITDFAREEGVTMEMFDVAIERVKEVYYTDALITGCVDDDADKFVKACKQATVNCAGIAI